MLEVTTCGVGIKIVVLIWNSVGVIFLPKMKFFLLQIWWSIFPDFRVDHLCRSEEIGRNRLIKLDSGRGMRSSNDSVDREPKFMVPPITWYLNKIAICKYDLGALVVFCTILPITKPTNTGHSQRLWKEARHMTSGMHQARGYWPGTIGQ